MRRKRSWPGGYVRASWTLASLVLIPVLWMVSTAFKSYGETISPNRPGGYRSRYPLRPSLAGANIPSGRILKTALSSLFFPWRSSKCFPCLAGYGLTRFKFGAGTV